MNDRADPDDDAARSSRTLPWRSPTTWLLAAYLALQSLGFYSPDRLDLPVLRVATAGRPGTPGLLLSVWSIAQLVTGVGGPALADRVRDRRPLVAAAVGAEHRRAGRHRRWRRRRPRCCGSCCSPSARAAASPSAWSSSSTTRPRRRRPPGCRPWCSWCPTRRPRSGPFVFGAVHDVTDGFTAPYALLLGGGRSCSSSLVPRLRPGPADRGRVGQDVGMTHVTNVQMTVDCADPHAQARFWAAGAGLGRGAPHRDDPLPARPGRGHARTR